MQIKLQSGRKPWNVSQYKRESCPAVRKPGLQAVACYMLLLFCCSNAQAQYSSANPGATDPHSLPSQRTLFRDDQLFAAFPPSNFTLSNPYLVSNLYGANQSVTQLSPVLSLGDPATSPNSLAVSGHFLSEAKAHLAYMYSTGSSLNVQLFDGLATQSNPPVFQTTLNNYAGPMPYGDALGMAAGDLDGASTRTNVGQVDSKHMLHEELVIAYRNASPVAPPPPPSGSDTYNITLEVIDFSQWDGSANPTTAITTNSSPELATVSAVPFNHTSQFGSPNYSGLSIATGDFDGDGNDEIALSYISGYSTIVSLYRYQTDATGKHTLIQLSSTSIAPVPPTTPPFGIPTYLLPHVSTVAGDFEGKGKNQQLALARVSAVDSADQMLFSPRLLTITFNGKYQPVLGTEVILQAPEIGSSDVSWPPLGYMKVQVVSGLFKFSPTPGVAFSDFNFGRRELALVFNTNRTSSAPGIIVHPFAAFGGGFTNLLTGTAVSLTTSDPAAYVVFTDIGDTNDFAVAAGGFGGVGNASVGNPLWSLAISSWFESANTNHFNIDLATFGSAGISESANLVVNSQPVTNANAVTPATLPLIAYDYEGKSVTLGSPVHITVPGVATTDFVIQEPPKHVYFNEKADTTDPSYPANAVVDVSRSDNFNSSLVDTTGNSLSLSKQNEYNYAWGISGAASASATIGGGLDIGIAGAKASVITDLNASVNFDSSSTASQLNTQYGTYAYSISGIANHDDFIARTTQSFDIWRYRVYGGSAPAGGSTPPLNNYVDFVVPGPYYTDYVFGLNYEDYQPIQENGNILSYPTPQVGGTYIPTDMGSYCLRSADPNCLNPVFGPLTAPASFQFGGGSTSFDLTFGSTTSNQGVITSSSTLKNSADIKVTVAATADFLGNGGKLSASVQAGRTSNSSWTHSNTAETTFTQTTELRGNTVPGDAGHSYAYYPVMYSTGDGTLKLAYGTKINDPENPAMRNFWNPLYGNKPDPALNLPWRFTATYPTPLKVVWTPTQGLQRKQMRGLFLRKNNPNRAGGYDYYTGTEVPTAGARVQVEARVYNYSLNPKPITYLDVQYEIANVDTSAGIAELPFTSCPNTDLELLPNGRCKISNSYIRNLGPEAFTYTHVVWNTAGFGSATPGASQSYLLFVVLDKSNIIDEIYDSEAPGTTDYGQNNEGWSMVTIMTPGKQTASKAFSKALTSGVTAQEASQEKEVPRDLSVGADSLGAIDTATGSLRFDRAQVRAGQPISVRLGAVTDGVSGRRCQVTVYDGDPKAGGKTLAIKNLVPVNSGQGTYGWFDWVPTEPGRHTLYARVQEDLNDPNPGNNLGKLEVLVGPYRQTAKH